MNKISLIIMVILAMFTFIVFTKADADNSLLEVICPPLKGETHKLIFPLGPTRSYTLSSSTDYCQCSLYVGLSGRTAIVKCDFKKEKDILLTENLLDFKKLNASSAYVRMTYTNSAKITSRFLKSWMNTPSAAFDLWYCGKVSIEGTQRMDKVATFPKLKTFMGIGVINCEMKELPPNLLRDRTRGAVRLKGCNVQTIRKGLLLNIEEVRYMVIENSVIDKIEGPLSTSGTITLSKKEMHSWDGFIMTNTTIGEISPNSFNITHMSDMETATINRCRIGKLGRSAIKMTGDIDVEFARNRVDQIDSYAVEISVTGKLIFADNNVSSFNSDSFYGLQCKNESTFFNNSFQVNDQTGTDLNNMPLFKGKCSAIKINYVEESAEKLEAASNTATYSAIGVILIGGFICLVVYWGWRNKYINPFQYKRSETPLFEENDIK